MSTARFNKESAPVIGFLAALLGTGIAMVLFPDNPAPRGALMLPAAALALGILAVPIVRALSGSREITNAENLVAFGFVFWLLLDLLQGAYFLNETTPVALRTALQTIGVSAAFVWLGVAGRGWRLPNWLTSLTSQPLETQTISRLVPICFALGMFNFAYACDWDFRLMFDSLGDDRFSAPWARGQLGGWGSFVDQMPYFGYVLPSLTALLAARRGWRGVTLIALVCSLIMLAFLSQSGGRRLVGVTVGAALLVWVQSNPQLRVRDYLIIAITGVTLAVVSQFMLTIRSGGLNQYFQTGRATAEYDYYHVDDNFLRLAQIIEIVPRSRDYVGAQMIVFTLVRPIPRVLWPNKPVDPGFDLAEEVRLKGVSISTSIVGEWYLAFGWFGVMFGGWLHGRLAKLANAVREHGQRVGNPIVYAMAVMVLVAGMRSMLDLVVMSYALVAWFVLNRWMSRRTAAVAA